MKIHAKSALEKLSKVKSPFLNVFEHGTLSVEVYKPEKIDLQQPHTRNEMARGNF